MRTNRILPALVIACVLPLWAWAQNPSQNPAAPPKEPPHELTASEKKIDDEISGAIKKLKAIQSASASIRVTADMLSQKFRLAGEYLKAPNYRVKYVLRLLDLGDSTGFMQQACDGVTRWNFIKILDGQQCSKLSLKPVLTALNKPECDADFRDNIIAGLGFAGPESLLAGLRKSFLLDQMRPGEFEGKPVWIIVGTWKDTTVDIGPNGQKFGNFAPLPPYIPSLVTIYLGKDDGWPYQVAFEGRIPPQIEGKAKDDRIIGPDGRPQGKKTSTPTGKPSKITLVYSNVKLNAVIGDDEFAFAPPNGVKPSDETDIVVAQLDEFVRQLASKKKADAAKATPVLGDALKATPPGGEGPAKLPGDVPK